MSDLWLFSYLISLWSELESLLEKGGVILTVIMITTFFLWIMILERLHYFFLIHKKLSVNIVRQWRSRRDRKSWYAQKIRLRLLSYARIKAENNLSIIKLVVVISPLLGLLGTVVGMIDVFDVMASTGASNARGMAAGVSKATIPTMAGMVVSLSGMLFSVSLQHRARLSLAVLANQLLVEGLINEK